MGSTVSVVPIFQPSFTGFGVDDTSQNGLPEYIFEIQLVNGLSGMEIGF
jgi:hypothetical protein